MTARHCEAWRSGLVGQVGSVSGLDPRHSHPRTSGPIPFPTSRQQQLQRFHPPMTSSSRASSATSPSSELEFHPRHPDSWISLRRAFDALPADSPAHSEFAIQYNSAANELRDLLRVPGKNQASRDKVRQELGRDEGAAVQVLKLSELLDLDEGLALKLWRVARQQDVQEWLLGHDLPGQRLAARLSGPDFGAATGASSASASARGAGPGAGPGAGAGAGPSLGPRLSLVLVLGLVLALSRRRT